MANYQKEELGKLQDIIKLENGKVFLHDLLKLTSCEISINTVPKGFKVPFNHKHKQNEEIYIVLKGNGIITIDGANVPINEGSAVKIPPSASRTIENTGDEEMQFICIQAKADSLEQYGLDDAELC